MRAIMSMLTRTPMFRLTREMLLVQTLSHCLARRAFGAIWMVTDHRGEEICARMSWRFEGVSRRLQFIPESLLHVWAVGKAFAVLDHGGPAIHLDWDVFLHKPLPARLLAAPLFAQSEDRPGYYRGTDMDRAMEISGLPKGGTAYNAGIVGGADAILLDRWAEGMIERASRFREGEVNGTAASMVCEQYWLGILAQAEGIEVATLLSRETTPEECRAAGYTHLHGGAKRQPYYLERAERRLREEFPVEYAIFLRGWRDLDKECLCHGCA